MKPREIILPSGVKIFLGRNAENNDELMSKFKGKENIILHTVEPGSPFCVLDDLKPTPEEIHLSGSACAAKSQDWRDNKSDVLIHQFTGKDVRKPLIKKVGTWKIKGKPKVIKIKKKDILKWMKKQNGK